MNTSALIFQFNVSTSHPPHGISYRFGTDGLHYSSLHLAIARNDKIEVNDLFAQLSANDMTHCQNEQEARVQYCSRYL